MIALDETDITSNNWACPMPPRFWRAGWTQRPKGSAYGGWEQGNCVRKTYRAAYSGLSRHLLMRPASEVWRAAQGYIPPASFPLTVDLGDAGV
jgi:hypothetical protein